jgi:UDP-N-acetylmuramoylalanine--D-glutamate ligase
MMRVRGKYVLVFGLGSLGGGMATTKWLLREGAIVRVTDKKDAQSLSSSVSALGRHRNLSFSLGGHNEEDIRWADLIIVNPGVPKESPFLGLARRLGKPLWNDTALFFSQTKRPIVGVTGTRGKTTVTLWIAKLLSEKGKVIHPTGNTPENPLLKEIGRKTSPRTPVSAELSSWQLELLPASKMGPKVAVITNLYPDHLNRYRDMEEYADAKANIFRHQTKRDALILNADHPWTPYFMRKKSSAKMYFASVWPLPKGKRGICVVDGFVALTMDGRKRKTLFPIERFRKEFGEHNVTNLLQAIIATTLISPKARIDEKKALRLATPKYRQEIIHKDATLIVVNDTTATSPDGTIAALRRFSLQRKIILITGGTDKELDFTDLAVEIKKTLAPENVILLEGSATRRLKAALGEWSSSIAERRTLKECVDLAFASAKKVPNACILFSPGAASFEKFKNEFDRGEQFSALVKDRPSR